MKCPICAEETIGEDVQKWGPEFAHTRCVKAYSLGRSDARAELRRLAAVEAELEALKKAISEAQPVAFNCIGNGLYYENDPYFGVHGAFQGERKALYTLKGIK